MTTEEAIIRELCTVLRGDGKKDLGVMTRFAKGKRHLIERWCYAGMAIQDGDSARGGADCSKRCARVHTILAKADLWLRENAREQERQMLLEASS